MIMNLEATDVGWRGSVSELCPDPNELTSDGGGFPFWVWGKTRGPDGPIVPALTRPLEPSSL